MYLNIVRLRKANYLIILTLRSVKKCREILIVKFQIIYQSNFFINLKRIGLSG